MKKSNFESFSSCKISTTQLNQLSGGQATGGGVEVSSSGYWRSWGSDETSSSVLFPGTVLTTYYGVAYGRSPEK